MTRSRAWQGLALAAAVVSLAACVKKANATASCKAVQAFDSRLGTLNAPNFPLGTIFVANTAQKQVQTLAVLDTGATDLVSSPSVATESIGFDSALDVTFAGNVDAQVKASLTSYIKNSSRLSLTNVTRVTMRDVQDLVNRNDRAKALFKDNAGPNLVLFVVTAVQKADSLALALADSSHAGANVSVVRVGDFELSVTYTCKADAGFTGNQFNALFKATPLAYDATTNSVRFDSAADVDFKEYRLTNALTMR